MSESPIFLLVVFQSCDDILEPTLDDLIAELRETGVYVNQWLTDHLTSRLSSLSSPDDLFNFFSDLRGELTIIFVFVFSLCFLHLLSTI